MRFSNFRTITRSRTLPRRSDKTDQFWQAASELLGSAVPADARASGVRLMGMAISGLAATRTVQQTLFDDPQAEQQEKQRSLGKLTDAVHARFGAAAIKRALGVQAGGDDAG